MSRIMREVPSVSNCPLFGLYYRHQGKIHPQPLCYVENTLLVFVFNHFPARSRRSPLAYPPRRFTEAAYQLSFHLPVHLFINPGAPVKGVSQIKG